MRWILGLWRPRLFGLSWFCSLSLLWWGLFRLCGRQAFCGHINSWGFWLQFCKDSSENTFLLALKIWIPTFCFIDQLSSQQNYKWTVKTFSLYYFSIVAHIVPFWPIITITILQINRCAVKTLSFCTFQLVPTFVSFWPIITIRILQNNRCAVKTFSF